MSEILDGAKLQDGTLIRHKVAGYEGRIEGTTGIQTCFTAGGALLGKPNPKLTFQYRVVVEGESMRRIAPLEDLEVLEGVAEVTCPRCRFSFHTKPGYTAKPAGRCQCGGWICPSCLACEEANLCPKQLKRLSRKQIRKKILHVVDREGKRP